MYNTAKRDMVESVNVTAHLCELFMYIPRSTSPHPVVSES